jgi:hypothetical protein
VVAGESGGPTSYQLGSVRPGEERRDILLPQGQIATSKLFGVGHGSKYTLGRAARKETVRHVRLFDDAIRPKHCIVVGEKHLRGETPRA